MPTAVFPALSWGEAFLCPSTRTTKAAARVVQFLDGSEQRWRSAPILESWALTFSGIELADVESLQDFFATVKGAYDPTWTFPFLGTNYLKMAFEQDAITPMEQPSGLYDVTLQLRQTVSNGGYPTDATDYPALSTGAIVQRPYSAGWRWQTTRNDLASGPRYAWAERAAVLGAWSIEYSALTSTEAGALMAHFCSMGGKYGEFAFDGKAHCRYDMDGLAMRYLGAGQCATSVQIAEYVA